MRRNLVTIHIEQFVEDVPEEFREYKLQVMEVYADGNDLYETLCGAFQLALDEVAKYHYDNFTKRRENCDSLKLTQRKVKMLGIDEKK